LTLDSKKDGARGGNHPAHASSCRQPPWHMAGVNNANTLYPPAQT